MGLSGSVGERGANARHDVALVQFMLSQAQGGKTAYYGGQYSGTYDVTTQKAIAAFGGDGAGALILPNGAAWARLVKAVPARYEGANAIPGRHVTVYLAGERQAAVGSANSVRADDGFKEEFRAKVVSLILEFYDRYQIVLSVEKRSGGRRTFAEQVGLQSNSAPGESIHHYGYAADIGFNGLRWVNGRGLIATANDWLQGLSSGDHAQAFWDARDGIAVKKLGLYRTDLKHDLIHLQHYEDGPLDSVTSFMNLMEAVGPRKMKWRPENMTPTDYWCDLGLGGDKYSVGTGSSIWKDSVSQLSKPDFVKAFGAKLKADPKFSIDQYLGLSTGAKPDAGTSPDARADGGSRDAKGDGGAPAPPALKESDATPGRLAAIQRLLRAEFEAADKRWREWRPVFYKTSARRPAHK